MLLESAHRFETFGVGLEVADVLLDDLVGLEVADVLLDDLVSLR